MVNDTKNIKKDKHERSWISKNVESFRRVGNIFEIVKQDKYKLKNTWKNKIWLICIDLKSTSPKSILNFYWRVHNDVDK